MILLETYADLSAVTLTWLSMSGTGLESFTSTLGESISPKQELD